MDNSNVFARFDGYQELFNKFESYIVEDRYIFFFNKLKGMNLVDDIEKKQDLIKIVDDTELFVDEFKELDNELSNINDLYDEIKTHFDQIKNLPTKGSLTFIEKQTTNLINLKSAKLNILKEKINAKRSLVDLSLKAKSISNKEMQNNTNNDTTEMLSTLIKELKYNREINDDMIEDIDYDEELESIIENNDELNNIEIEDIKKDIEEEEENSDSNEESFIAVDKKTGEFYKLNNDYEILEELGKIEKISEYTTYEDDEYGIGKDTGNSYVVIEVE